MNAVTLDLPGFGVSPPPDGPWGAREFAAAVAPVLDDIGEPVVVLGFSFGGRVAVHLAAAYPERVRALVLTGVPLLRRTGKRNASIAFRLLKRGNKLGIISDQRMEAERSKRGSPDYRRASGVMRDVLVRAVNESYEDELPRVRCKVELVWGELDTAAPLWVAETAHARLPDSHLTVVPGRTHFLPEEEPEQIRAAIKRCLA